MQLTIMIPTLDHPRCNRFITEMEIQMLESSHKICKLIKRVFIQLVDEENRTRILSNIIDDFEEMLINIPREERGARSVLVREFLKGFLDRSGLPYVCCFVSKTLLTTMNCCVFLDISVASPKMWFDFITGPEMDIFVE
jgi:hypothetical protein